MKIGVVAPAASPYTRGGFERLWSGFVNHVNDRTNHQAELIKLPFPESTLHEVIAGYKAFSALDVSGFDMVLTSKYPSWMVDHPNHHIYLCHTLRGLYDTYPDSFPLDVDPGHGIADLVQRIRAAGSVRRTLPELFAVYDEAVARLGPDHPAFGYPGPFGRLLVHALDRLAMSDPGVRRHLAIAHTVAGRDDYFPPSATVGVIHPPTDLTPERNDTPGGYFFTASRLDAPKRLDLVIEAYRSTGLPHELVIAGTGPEQDRLAELAGDDPRVRLVGFVPDEDMPGLYAGAIAVPFVPDREDYGLIALEALASGTPVITCDDSGGPTELVDHDVTGLVVAPSVEALAAAFDALGSDPTAAREMGIAGRDSVADITWDNLTNRLLRPVAAPQRSSAHEAATGRPRAIVLNTFTAHNPRGGGQLRAFHLYRSLARHFDVELLSLAAADERAFQVTPARGFTESAIPRSDAHRRLEDEMAAQIGVPVNDVYGGLGIHLTPDYLREFRQRIADADLVILAHPYMHPVLDHVPVAVPVVYDSYNVEARLKDDIYPRSEAGDAAVEAVRLLEARSVEAASLITTCSAADAAMMESVYGALPPTIVVANGADIDEIEFTCGTERIERRRRWLHAADLPESDSLALYLASWHPPNLDAATAIHDIAPELPDVDFLMIGSHVDYFAGRTLPSNVLQLGLIGDATKRVLLGAADLGLNPMATGSGTNLKIVEYLAAGLNTVTTPVGARGLPVDDPPLFTTVELDDFATGIRSALEVDHDQRIEVARSARTLVELQYSWRVLGDRFAEAIRANGLVGPC